MDAALALNGLNDHRCSGTIDGRFHRIEIAKINEHHTGHQRLERLAIFLAARRRKRTDRLPVEAPVRADDFAAAGRALHKLESRLNSFRPRVREESELQIARADFGQFCREIRLLLAEHRLAAHRHCVELLLHGLDHLRMPVPQTVNAVSTQAVEVFPAVMPIDVATLGARLDAEPGEVHQLREVGVNVVGVLLDDVGLKAVGVHGPSISGLAPRPGSLITWQQLYSEDKFASRPG